MAHELDELPLHAVVQSCREQTERWRRGLESDTRFCLEIFRRALAIDGAGPGTPEASNALVELYTPFVRTNIARRAAGLLARSGDDLVQEVWLAFWSASQRGLSFPSLPQALQYLQLTTVTAVFRALRETRQRAREEQLEESVGARTLSDQGPTPFDSSLKQLFLERAKALLGEEEYLIFWLRTQQGLPPRDIAGLLAREGHARGWAVRSTAEIYRVIERAFRKLRDDPAIRDLLSED